MNLFFRHHYSGWNTFLLIKIYFMLTALTLLVLSDMPEVGVDFAAVPQLLYAVAVLSIVFMFDVAVSVIVDITKGIKKWRAKRRGNL